MPKVQRAIGHSKSARLYEGRKGTCPGTCKNGVEIFLMHSRRPFGLIL